MRTELAAVVRADARLELVGETLPLDLKARVAALDPDAVLEQHDDRFHPALVPSVALVDDPLAAWVQTLEAEERGAHAILARDASPSEIAAALIAVAAGLVAVQPRVLAPGGGAASSARGDAERLTTREIEVLGELARGVANKAIAARLGISEHTVKFHVAAIFAKLAVSSRTEAVTHGVRLGLIML